MQKTFLKQVIKILGPCDIYERGRWMPLSEDYINNKFEGDWDTEWLFDLTLDDLKRSPLKRFNAKISEADGTFACMMHHDSNMFIFRNEISPLFSEGSSFSSTKFENSIPVPANTMWELDYGTGGLVDRWKFETKENPYHFGE